MIEKFVKKYQHKIFLVILLQYILATFGSLFYSTYGDPVSNWMELGTIYGTGLTPCLLCWFARILMYPGVFISFFGILKQDLKFTDYTLSLAMPGIALEIYHYSIQKINLKTSASCSLDNPCNALQVDYFDFITIPFLCLVAFLIIGVLSFLNSYYVRNTDERKAFLKASIIYGVICAIFLASLYLLA